MAKTRKPRPTPRKRRQPKYLGVSREQHRPAECPFAADVGYVDGRAVTSALGGWVVVYDRQAKGPEEFERAVAAKIEGFTVKDTRRFILMHRPSGKWVGRDTLEAAWAAVNQLVPSSYQPTTQPARATVAALDIEGELEVVREELNDRQIKFVHALLDRQQPRSRAEAYLSAGYRSSQPAKEAHGCLQLPAVARYYKLLVQEQEEKAWLGYSEWQAFLADVVRTPAGMVTKDSPLCQEYRDTEDGTVIKLPDKLAAGKEVAASRGWNKGDMAAQKSAEAVAALATLMRDVMGGQVPEKKKR